MVSVARSAENISQSMQLIAERTAQENNDSQVRSGAFWQDCYHATAIDSKGYLLNYMIYNDLNMVRAKVVKHPREGPFCGFQEIMDKAAENRLIDLEALQQFLDCRDIIMLQKEYRQLLKKKLYGALSQQAFWSAS